MTDDWISTKERLPEKDGEYLCTFVDDDYDDYCGVRIFSFEDGQFNEELHFPYIHVVAWMELPLIYGENSDDTDSDWIPSNSKLPENDGMYIGTIRLYNYYSTDGFHDVIGDGPQDHIMICQFRHNSFSEERCYQNVDVLAWMNIPNAYKS